MTASACRQFKERAPDLALGLLTGDERGTALHHVATCAACRRHLEALVQVTDDLLLLAPSTEPAIGFESRVTARLTAEGAFARPLTDAPSARLEGDRPLMPAVRARRRRFKPMAVAIAAAIVVIAAAGGLATGLARGRDVGRRDALQQQGQLAARTVVLRADAGRSTCDLVAFPSSGTEPARLVISLDEPGERSSTYLVLAERTDGGPAIALGRISVVDGHGSISAAIPAGAGPVDAVRIMDGADVVRYRATFLAV